MNVQRATTTMRDRSRLTSRAPGTVTAEATKEDAITFSDITMPPDIYPGSTLRIGIEVRNRNSLISPLDADFCVAANLMNGYEIDVYARMKGQEEMVQLCVPNNGRRSKSMDFITPVTSGTYTVEFEARTRNSDRLVERTTRSIKVTQTSGGTGDSGGSPAEGGDPDSVDSGRCPSGYYYSNAYGFCVPEGTNTSDDSDDPDKKDGGGPILPCFLDPNRKCEGTQSMTYAAGAGALLVLAVLAKA